MPAYREVAMQRGYGLGGLFKGLMRVVTPHIKQGLKKVGKRALKTGLEVIGDVAQGENIKSSLKRRATENVQDFISSSPTKKQRTNSNKTTSSKAARGRGRRGRKASPLGIL